MHFLIFSSNDVYRHRTHNTQEIYLLITLWIPTVTHGRGDILAWALVGLRVAVLGALSWFWGHQCCSFHAHAPMTMFHLCCADQKQGLLRRRVGKVTSRAGKQQCKDNCDSPIKISTFFL